MTSQKTLACLIIDDPLLRPRYGFLDYAKLLAAMKRHRFFTQIAFIPWNYRRTDPQTARLLVDNPDYYSLCVHGCNHTAGEFDTRDYPRLRSLIALAQWRMDQHAQTTGVQYDPVFVFPQGRFTTTAMQALKDWGYSAVVNTTLGATDQPGADLSCERLPFTRAYADLPLFTRRYPEPLSGFDDDIASGRPVIVVGHHTLFRDGYGLITDLVDRLNALGDLEWCPLARIAERYTGAPVRSLAPLDGLPCSTSLWTGSRIACRRRLSEFRDNHIQRSACYRRVLGV